MSFHPGLPAVYRPKVEQLEQALQHPVEGATATALVRGLIGRLVVKPQDDGGLRVELQGDLAALLALSDAATTKGLERGAFGLLTSQVSVVAGARNHLCRTIVHFQKRRSAWPSSGNREVGSPQQDPVG